MTRSDALLDPRYGPLAASEAVIDFCKSHIGPVEAVADWSWPHGGSRVLELRDERGGGWIAKARGLVKLVEDADRGVLVGATAVGPSGGEMLSMLTTAVHAEVPTDTLRSMIYAYPTFHRAVEATLAELG